MLRWGEGGGGGCPAAVGSVRTQGEGIGARRTASSDSSQRGANPPARSFHFATNGSSGCCPNCATSKSAIIQLKGERRSERTPPSASKTTPSSLTSFAASNFHLFRPPSTSSPYHARTCLATSSFPQSTASIESSKSCSSASVQTAPSTKGLTSFALPLSFFFVAPFECASAGGSGRDERMDGRIWARNDGGRGRRQPSSVTTRLRESAPRISASEAGM